MYMYINYHIHLQSYYYFSYFYLLTKDADELMRQVIIQARILFNKMNK